ncbi:glutathione peroxidase, partial [Paracoccaceae bacterium]|nr:glutathione peroxidase [Paracoccaceae bacterium]
ELGYSTTMPMTGITKVKGPNAHPFFKWAKRSAGFVPSWNFNKLLIDQNGQIVKSFGSVARPSGRKITSEIEILLQ